MKKEYKKYTLIKSAKTPQEKKELEQENTLLAEVTKALNTIDEKAVRSIITAGPVATVPLLSAKNFIVIANISEAEVEGNAYSNNPHYQALVKKFGAERVIPVAIRLEYEITVAPEHEVQEIMELAGLKEPALNTIIRATYKNLGLITFFTCGPKEAHAWPIRQGITVRQAAGEIHSDLERGFICAEIFNCHDLFATLGSETALKNSGKIRTEGQQYIVQDGDLLNIKFNV